MSTWTFKTAYSRSSFSSLIFLSLFVILHHLRVLHSFFACFHFLLRCLFLFCPQQLVRVVAEQMPAAAHEQALDLLVPVSFIHCCMSTSGLSPRRLQGVLLLSNGISLLEGGFTLRCLQRLSLPDLATRPCTGCATDTPAVRPFRSSRTKNSSSQISCAHDG